MVYLSKKDAEIIIKELSKVRTKDAREILEKIKIPRKQVYVRNRSGIRQLLQKAFHEKRSIKIKYYSLSTDEVRFRVVNVLKIHKDCIIAYCHLRKEERTFVIDRIYAAVILEEKYNIPEGWRPESIILEK